MDAPIPAPSGTSLQPMRVRITREPFGDYFTLHLDNRPNAEELDPEETRKWFKEHGADMEKLETVLDECWNFYEAVCTISSYKEPKLAHPDFQPNV